MLGIALRRPRIRSRGAVRGAGRWLGRRGIAPTFTAIRCAALVSRTLESMQMTPVEPMYPLTRTDSTGEPLDGSKHNYDLTNVSTADSPD